jgi:hypothetical protein
MPYWDISVPGDDALTLGRRPLLLIPRGGDTEIIAPPLRDATIPYDDDSPDPVPLDRRAISARTAPSHLISSSSDGAHSSKVRFVVTILNV